MPVGRSRNVGAVVFLEDLTRIQAQAQQTQARRARPAHRQHRARDPQSAVARSATPPSCCRRSRRCSDTAARLLHDHPRQHAAPGPHGAGRAEAQPRATARTARASAGRLTCRPSSSSSARSRRSTAAMFRARTGGDDLEVMFDRSHLNQVMWNLCRNALRYCQRKTGEHPHRGSGSGHAADTVELDVIDDGPGVPPSAAQPAVRAVLHHRGERHRSRPVHRARDLRGERRHARVRRDAPAGRAVHDAVQGAQS